MCSGRTVHAFTRRPHEFPVENGHYLVMAEPDSAQMLVLVTKRARVTFIRAGLRPWLECNEGCP